MPVVPCNIGRFAVRVGDQVVAFEPHRGTIAMHGRPPRLSDGPGAALILIATTDVDRVVETLRAEDHGHGEDVHALATQRGSLSQKSATEEATRAMIFQWTDETSEAFRARAIAKTERLLGRLSVCEAILELQVRGMRTEVLGIVL